MPTGYTADVQNGKTTAFPEFVMRCARNFGALVLMRDEPSDAPAPERFEPHTSYHDAEMAKAEVRLSELKAMSLPAIREAAHQANAEAVKVNDAWRADRLADRGRYEAMLAKVEAWEPPTPDHIPLKDFMLQQLRESIRFDCTVHPKEEEPARMEPEMWHAMQVEQAEWNRSYHAQKIAEEIARTEQRNRWLAQLRASLKPAE